MFIYAILMFLQFFTWTDRRTNKFTIKPIYKSSFLVLDRCMKSRCYISNFFRMYCTICSIKVLEKFPWRDRWTDWQTDSPTDKPTFRSSSLELITLVRFILQFQFNSTQHHLYTAKEKSNLNESYFWRKWLYHFSAYSRWSTLTVQVFHLRDLLIEILIIINLFLLCWVRLTPSSPPTHLHTS